MSDESPIQAQASPTAAPQDRVPPKSRKRRSDRLSLEVPIRVSGTNTPGKVFKEYTRAVIVSRHGAKILVSCALIPEQKLTIDRVPAAHATEARVTGQIGSGPEGQYYGVEFLNPEVDLWGIEFPPLADAEKAAARVLLTCGRCQHQALVYLNEFEAELFVSNLSLSRRCKRCENTSLWRRSSTLLASAPAPPPPKVQAPAPAAKPGVTSSQKINRRLGIRVALRIEACVRTRDREEVVITENVSRGGMSFKSAHEFVPGDTVEVAVPFARGAANTFAPGEISHAQYSSTDGRTIYGVKYVQEDQEWPRDE
jgi:hypothetical protein